MFNETLCKTTAVVALEQAGAHVLSVTLAGESLYHLWVEERQWEPRWGGKPRKTGQNRAVYVTYAAGGHHYTSLEQAAIELARLGLDPEPLLALALTLGWEPALVQDARLAAANVPPYIDGCFPQFADVYWCLEDITEENGLAVNWDGDTAYRFLIEVEEDLAQAMCEAGRAFLEAEARSWAEDNQIAPPVSADESDDETTDFTL